MIWTKNMPVTPGWYWWRSMAGSTPRMLLVGSDGRFLCFGDSLLTRCADIHGEWYGPVEPPQ